MRTNRTESHQSDEPYTDYPHTINRRSTEWLYTALVLRWDLTAAPSSTMTQPPTPRLQRDLAAPDLRERYGGLEQITPHVDVVEVECGLQGTEQAVENAEQFVWKFLAATGALPDGSEPSERTLPVFALPSLILKPDGGSYAVHVENFERVEKGAVVATVDGEELTAEESCYPVLVSEHGYDQCFGSQPS